MQFNKVGYCIQKKQKLVIWGLSNSEPEVSNKWSQSEPLAWRIAFENLSPSSFSPFDSFSILLSSLNIKKKKLPVDYD